MITLIPKPIDVVIASSSKIYLLNKLDGGCVLRSSLDGDKNIWQLGIDREVNELDVVEDVTRGIKDIAEGKFKEI